MSDDAKPRRAKVKLTRTVTEIAVVILDRDGGVEEIEDIHDEIDYDVTDVHSVLSVLSVHP